MSDPATYLREQAQQHVVEAKRLRDIGHYTGSIAEDAIAFGLRKAADHLDVPAAPDPEWEKVTHEQVKVGDDIEVRIATKLAETVVRGVVTMSGPAMVYLLDQIEIPLDLPGTTIRRARTPIAEPGPGAVWECAGKRYYNTGARDHEDKFIWATPGDPEGSYDWTDVQLGGTPTEVLAAADLGGGV